MEVYNLHDAYGTPRLLQQWIDFESQSENLYSMYGSVEWLNCLNSSDNSLKILFYLNDRQQVENVVPLEIREQDLPLLPFASFPAGMKLLTATIISSEPFGVVSSTNYGRICRHLFASTQRLGRVYFKNIYLNSPVHRELKAAVKNSPDLCCVESLPREFSTLVLKDSFDSYLAMFSKKERYNLRRQCRLAQEAAGGLLELRSVTTEHDVDFFASCSIAVLNNSWKSHMGEAKQFFSEKKRREYAELARKGMLRSYLLLGNGEPWAFVLGFQRKKIFHYANIAYDQTQAHLSPGTVLFYLMLEELHAHDKPAVLNFGVGESFYKRRFGTDTCYDCSITVMKKNIRSRLICSWLSALDKVRLMRKRYMEAAAAKCNAQSAAKIL